MPAIQRGKYAKEEEEIMKALKTDAYPDDGYFKNIFRSPEEAETVFLSLEFLEAITLEINNSGTEFAKRTWNYICQLPDVENLFIQDVMEQSYALRSLSKYFKNINWPNFLLYIENELPLLEKFADSMRTWVNEYKDEHHGRSPSFDELAQHHATLCTDPRFIVGEHKMIYAFHEIMELVTARGIQFNDEFLLYSFHMAGYAAGQHNGKVFG